jgi:hypothetical protein
LIFGGAIAYKSLDIELITDMEDTIKATLNSLASDTGSSTGGIRGFSILEVLDGIAMALIISGILLLLFSLCGCCGVWCPSRTAIFIVSI